MFPRKLQFMNSLSKSLALPLGMTLKTDSYRSIHLACTQPIPDEPFTDYLRRLTQVQQDHNKECESSQETNAIWVHLKLDNFCHCTFLCGNGFKIYQGLGEEMSLYRWISSRECLIPAFSPFIIACGAAVIHQDRILLVKEKNGARKGKYGLPGGRADLGEFISDCSERELREEVGLKAKFKSILYFRQLSIPESQQMDLYFVCLMEFEENTLGEIKLCEREIEDFQWVPFEEYDSFTQAHSCGTQREVASYICSMRKQGFDFRKDRTPFSKGYKNISPSDHIERHVIEHQLVQP